MAKEVLHQMFDENGDEEEAGLYTDLVCVFLYNYNYSLAIISFKKMFQIVYIITMQTQYLPSVIRISSILVSKQKLPITVALCQQQNMQQRNPS